MNVYYKKGNASINKDILNRESKEGIKEGDLKSDIRDLKKLIETIPNLITLNVFFNTKPSNDDLSNKISSLYNLPKTSGDQEKKSALEKKKPQDYNDIFIKSGNKLVKVAIDTILFVKTDSKNYCSLITINNNKFSVRYSITSLLKKLDYTHSHFIQTHRSYAINWRKIEAFHEYDQTVVIEGHHIPIGRTFKDKIYKKIRVI